MALNAKQKRFCEEYMIDLNATQAAARAGYCLQINPGCGYFVYFLCDPGTGSIFYIGKGKGRRPYNHLNTSGRIYGANVKKKLAIKNIVQAGKAVDIFYFSVDISEGKAFSVEKCLIKMIGKFNLTNISSGFNRETEKDRALFQLQRVKKLSVYCAENRNAWQIEMYLRIVAELKKLAA